MVSIAILSTCSLTLKGEGIPCLDVRIAFSLHRAHMAFLVWGVGATPGFSWVSERLSRNTLIDLTRSKMSSKFALQKL